MNVALITLRTPPHSSAPPPLAADRPERMPATEVVIGFDDSMPDLFHTGDPVLVDRSFTTCDHDGVYYFRVRDRLFGDMYFIRNLQRIGGDHIVAHASHPYIQSWTISPDMDFEVLGRVVRAWRSTNC